MKTQDFWDITPYRLVVTNASKDRNALIFRVQQSNKRLLRRLDLDNETLPVHTVWLLRILESSGTTVWNPQISLSFTFSLWLLKVAANKQSDVTAVCLPLRQQGPGGRVVTTQLVYNLEVPSSNFDKFYSHELMHFFIQLCISLLSYIKIT